MSNEVPQLEIQASRQFTSWLHEQKISLAFSTYQTGKLFFIGLGAQNKLSVFERTFERCMGLCASPDGQTLWMSSLYQLWRFENALPSGHVAKNYDRLYVPQLAYTTGDIDMHDIGLDQEGQPVFANTLFSCLAAPSASHSFRPLWKPSFISRLAAEDRCHLNGFTMVHGVPGYATAVSTTDIHEGWRPHRKDGGVVIDIRADKILTQGLSMPHSPRWYEGKLYLLNSGAGYFGSVNLDSGEFEPICFCPGYARGLAIANGFAVIGLSTCRENKTFQGLLLDQELERQKASARCGLLVVDLKTGDVVHSLTIEGIVRELYDVVILPEVRSPSAIGLKNEEIRRTITIDEQV
jgi:uncharacterized protein (TIGR03032 family)